MTPEEQMERVVSDNLARDPHFYDDPNLRPVQPAPIGPHIRRRENMGTFAVIRNDGTVLVVNAENEDDVLDNVLGSSAINYIRQIEPYDPAKHLSPTEFAAYQERQKAIASGTAVPGDVSAVNDAFAGVVDQATLDAAIRRVLGMAEPVAQVEPATPDAAVNDAPPAPTAVVDEAGGITPDAPPETPQG